MARPAKNAGPNAGASVNFPPSGDCTVQAEETLGAALRRAVPGVSWSHVRKVIEGGKVSVDGDIVVDPALRLRAGQGVLWQQQRRNPNKITRPDFRIVFEDSQLVIIDKPEGISSVPYDRKETGTAMDVIRQIWRAQGRKAAQQPLYIVHRIDKDTSGLLCFAKSKSAERGLHRIFKQHLATRTYVAVVHGHAQAGRIESNIVADRGDGIRGSTRFADQGQRSVTHVSVAESLANATVVIVRLETGRTHQIRIHLSERGHPLVGETVYIRNLRREEKAEIQSPRLLLHAATLGFDHPLNGKPLRFTSPLPDDFCQMLKRLGSLGPPDVSRL